MAAAAAAPPTDARVDALRARLQGYFADGLVAGGNGAVEAAGGRTLRMTVGCWPRLSRPTTYVTLDAPWADHVEVTLPLVPQAAWAPAGAADWGSLLAAHSALAAVRVAMVEDAPWLVVQATMPLTALVDVAVGPRLLNALLGGARNVLSAVDSLAVARYRRVPCTCPASVADAVWLRAHGFTASATASTA
jgi:hypothetical protein